MRRLWARMVLAFVITATFLTVAALPAAARDTYFLAGPIEIRVTGAGGQARDFLAISPEDRQAALDLVQQLSHELQAPAEPVAETANTLPHYRIGISQLGLNYLVVWPRLPETTLVYYPGGDGKSFLMVDSNGRNLPQDGWWLGTTPDVAHLLDHHLEGLPPIGSVGSVVPSTLAPAFPWELVVGGVVLGGLSIMLIEDRRRWQKKKRSAGPKGT